MEALYKINPSLHQNLSRMKQVGVFTWILGWGIYSNARNIAKIKDNIHILQKQNQLQDEQIKQLAKYLSLTMNQVDRHSEMLYEMDTKMTIMNKTIQQLMWNFNAMHYETNLLHKHVSFSFCLIFNEMTNILFNRIHFSKTTSFCQSI